VCQQDTAAHFQSIFYGLQSGSERLPFVVPEVGMGCTSGHDEVIVGKLESVQLEDAPPEVEAEHVTQQHFDILMLGEDLANGRRDLCRRQSCRRHLVEQRLKGVMVLAVHQGDLDRQARQRIGSLQTAKSASYNDDARARFSIHSPTGSDAWLCCKGATSIECQVEGIEIGPT